MDKIIAYKGFDAEMKCRDFQFEVGQTYIHDGDVVACESGFHACENPFDVWGYYHIVRDDGSPQRFAEVELSGDMSRHGDKIAAAQITIREELRLPDFVKRAVDAVIATADGKGDCVNTNGAQIGSSGDGAQIGSSGDGAQIGSSGYGAQIGSSGDYALIGSSGYDARIGSSGDGAQIGSSGYGARINSDGQEAVIAGAGLNTRVKGKMGTWVSLASYGSDGKCNGFGSGCIGKDGLKPDTWYRAENGTLVEAR